MGCEMQHLFFFVIESLGYLVSGGLPESGQASRLFERLLGYLQITHQRDHIES